MIDVMTTERLSKSGLERMHNVLEGHVERREMPGLVALVSRGDDVHVETIGSLDFDNRAPMRRDTIFRIASLSKLVTAVAAMILVEDCRLRLDDSIDSWLPEMANRQVLRSIESDLDDTVPANRPITVRDLLTYRMGFGSVMAMPGTYPIQRQIRDLRLGGDGPGLPSQSPRMDEWLRRLGSLPLMAQPGKRWMYHNSGDLLGALVARVAGQPLGEFMRERIFAPLGMRDTGFHLPIEKQDRLPAMYAKDPETGRLEYFDNPARSDWTTPPPFESAGGGLLSTLDDFFAFCRMMLNKGRLGDAQILSRPTVELMTQDHLTPENRTGSELFFGEHSSWGLGFAVDTARRDVYHNPGRFGWTGGFGTTAYIDPAEDLIGILFTQRMMDSPEPPRVFTDFWTLAYTVS
jgi:CubicO group peptidase (beta-lactamase class C family)